MGDGTGTRHLLGVTGLVSGRDIVPPVNQRYLSTKFVRKILNVNICNFVFSLNTQLQSLWMPWKYSILLS